MKQINRPPSITYPEQEEPAIISKPLMDLLLEQDNPSDLIGLYCFYYYTAKWQKTNQPRATTHYTANGIKWGIKKVQKVKLQLKELGLIEDVTTRSSIGIEGHYIRINFIFGTPTTRYPVRLGRGTETERVPKTPSNALKPNNIIQNLLPKNRIPPTLDQVRDYCKSRNNSVDPEKFIDYNTSRGWLVGRVRMKDWQAAVRTWERNTQETANKFKPKYITDQDGQWDLASNGFYYHHSGNGDKYRP